MRFTGFKIIYYLVKWDYSTNFLIASFKLKFLPLRYFTVHDRIFDNQMDNVWRVCWK